MARTFGNNLPLSNEEPTEAKSLVILQQELRVDGLEAQTSTHVGVLFLDQRTQHHALPLGLRVQHARPQPRTRTCSMASALGFGSTALAV